jgi:hypothetical protein
MKRVILTLVSNLLHRMAGFVLLPAILRRDPLPTREGMAAGVLARRARTAAPAGGNAVQPGRDGGRPAGGQGQGEEVPESDMTSAWHMAAHVVWFCCGTACLSLDSTAWMSIHSNCWQHPKRTRCLVYGLPLAAKCAHMHRPRHCLGTLTTWRRRCIYPCAAETMPKCPWKSLAVEPCLGTPNY